MTDDQLIMVSEWMANGNIVEFVKVHTSVDRLGLVRFRSRSNPPATDDDVIAIARGRHSGVDLHA